MHGLKIQNYKKKGNNEDSDTKEKKAEEIKCASTNTGSDVISMFIAIVQIKPEIPRINDDNNEWLPHSKHSTDQISWLTMIILQNSLRLRSEIPAKCHESTDL